MRLVQPLLVLIASVPASAFADDAPSPGVLPIVASVIPGFVIPGAGSFVATKRSMSLKLLEMAGIGLGMAIIGGESIVISGSNPRASGIGGPVLVAGVGLFETAWLTDVYNVVGLPHGTPRTHPPYSLEAGVSWTHDAYRDRALLHAVGQAIPHERIELIAEGHRSYDGAYKDGNLAARVRILHPHFLDDSFDGSYLEIRAAGRIRDDSADMTQAFTMEAEVGGRLDLHHISSLPRGVFAELSTGLGEERSAYAMAHDWNSLLLARVAWGMYLGHSGELSIYYDHRRDSIAGGFASWHAAGFFGSFGARADLRVTEQYAVHAEFEWGSATVSTVGIRYEGGPR
ncbi:hypothetical protein BH11MYX2_BH11MYX2_28250 [soil metagenome]